MPRVGNKKFPYTPKGKAAAAKAKKPPKQAKTDNRRRMKR